MVARYRIMRATACMVQLSSHACKCPNKHDLLKSLNKQKTSDIARNILRTSDTAFTTDHIR